MGEKLNIVICGDLCPTITNEQLFKDGKSESLFGNINSLIMDSEISIVNLECPFTKNNVPIKKSGPAIRASEEAIRAIKDAGFSAVNLANNHIKDFGDIGVINTMKLCSKNNIRYVGAGNNSMEAKEPLIVDVQGKKICIISFAEHESSIANSNEPGANGFDIFDSFDDIRNYRNKCDFVIILYHGGIEHYVYPSPLLQKKCRKMVECGAQLVICQHSHCVGTYEEYNNGTIIYGQGNFLFDYNNKSTMWTQGIIVKLLLELNGNYKVEYIPIESKDGKVDIMSNEYAKYFLDDFYKRSKAITDINFVENNWNNFCLKNTSRYMALLSARNKLFYYINRLTNNYVFRLFYKESSIITLQNIIRCEAHNEALLTILENYLIKFNKKNRREL